MNWAMNTGVSRRRLLSGAAALAGGLVASTSAAAALAATQPARTRLTLPEPTGRYDVGTVALHLVDDTRQDPWWATTHARELMVSLWYPARNAGRCDLAPWMTSAALTYYRVEEEDRLQQVADRLGLQLDVSLADIDFPITHARQDAPVERAAHPYPVVLYSAGFGANRVQGSTLVEDLASHGYVVVAIDHTYDAAEVEFPGGRVEPARPGLDHDGHIQVAVRRADTQFVLDQLTALAAGANPDAEHRPLPAGLRGCLDLARIGMFGHSLGGATTGQTMANDDRVIAGIDLDGTVIPDVPAGPPMPPEEAAELVAAVARRIGDRPFMIMSSNGKGPDELGALMTGFWDNLPGWRRFLSMAGSTHGSYTDAEPLFHQLAAAGIITPAMAASALGTVDPGRATAAERAYIHAFFDLWLRDHDAHLLDGPSAQYPEIAFF
jgi:hypothetical protein